MASVLSQLKKLDDERAKLLAGAKEEAMGRLNEALVELNSLGFNYRAVEGGQGKSRPARTQKDAPCPVCGFKTSPLHDGRAHRNHKEAFTAADLKERGMFKVS